MCVARLPAILALMALIALLLPLMAFILDLLLPELHEILEHGLVVDFPRCVLFVLLSIQ